MITTCKIGLLDFPPDFPGIFRREWGGGGDQRESMLKCMEVSHTNVDVSCYCAYIVYVQHMNFDGGETPPPWPYVEKNLLVVLFGAYIDQIEYRFLSLCAGVCLCLAHSHFTLSRGLMDSPTKNTSQFFFT